MSSVTVTFESVAFLMLSLLSVLQYLLMINCDHAVSLKYLHSFRRYTCKRTDRRMHGRQTSPAPVGVLVSETL